MQITFELLLHLLDPHPLLDFLLQLVRFRSSLASVGIAALRFETPTASICCTLLLRSACISGSPPGLHGLA
ncbi:hypothetical protein SLA2020_505280 [Shorea laevis]